MNRFIIALAALSLAASTGASAGAPSKASAKGEAQLAKLLEGRVAGKPQSCVPGRLSDRLQIIDGTALVYKGGDTVYVARADNPKSIRSTDILIINRFGSQLCRQDIVRTVDRNSGFMTGAIFLGDFVPYTKG